MSSYAYINGAFRGVAENLYPGIKYIHATPDQVAQVNLQEDQPIFAIYSGYQLTRLEIDSSTDQSEGFGVYIGLPDTFESDPVQQDNLIHTAEIMIEQALTAAEAVGEDIAMTISNIRKTPVRKRGADTNTGIWCECRITINNCLPNIYPSLSEFMGHIGRTISPYDWMGVTRNESARINQ